MITIKFYRVGLGVDVRKLGATFGWFKGDNWCLFSLTLLDFCPEIEMFYIIQLKIIKLSLVIYFEQEEAE